MLDTTQFLNALFPPSVTASGGIIEVRAFSPTWASNPTRRQWFLESVGDVAGAINQSHATPLDFFFGVCPRSQRSGKKESVKMATCVWADLDAKSFGSVDACWKALNLANSGMMSPSIVVFSGGGLHAYWLLSEPTTEVDRVNKICIGISKRIQSDRTYDLSRVLRLPGTYNQKMEGKPRHCYVAAETGRRFHIDYFSRFEAIGREHYTPTFEAGSEVVCPDDQILRNMLSENWYTLVRDGYSAINLSQKFLKPDGSVDKSSVDFAVSCHLAKLGLSPEEVAGVLLCPDYGISDKALSKPSESAARQYALHTAAKAHKYAAGGC